VIIALAFALLFGGVGGYYIKTGHAQTISNIHICLNSAKNECIYTPGPGKIAVLRPPNQSSTFKVTSSSDGLVVTYQFQNLRGQCLENTGGANGGNAGVVEVRSAACSGLSWERWILETKVGTVPMRFLNVQRSNYRGYLGSSGSTNGSPVFDIPPHSGIFWGWVYEGA
jgi:hypothetical protein